MKKNFKFDEKRNYPRLRAYHLAKYRLITDSPGGPIKLTSLKDIGGGGACMRSDERLPLTSLVQLYINFPRSSHPVPSVGKVVWIKEIGKTKRYEIGLQFMEIEDLVRKDIANRVNSVDQVCKEIKKRQ
jgi:c-di-GMP-binding flagellar brake protein YcgR